MEPSQKATVEKRVVIALLALLGLTLTGMLKSLGLFGHAAVKKAAPERVRIEQTLVEAIQDHVRKMEPPQETQAPTPGGGGRAVAASSYTAQGLRDPLMSLLPKAPAREVKVSAAPKETVKPPVPPPRLTVRGLLWGGPEPEAIINDEVYRVGETVGGAKILSIDRTGITIEHQGKPAFYPTPAPVQPERSRSSQAHWR